jgi:hypothetical protein
MKAIAYYVSSHGYGHGVRSCDIIGAIRNLRPEQPLIVVSQLPAEFLRYRMPSGSFVLRPAAFDVGMVQLDSIRVDVSATLAKVGDLLQRGADLVRTESEFLQANDVGLVVADIPAIPLEAAARAGVPAIAVGNFGWDWIYSAFRGRDPRWEEVAQCFSEGYARADLLLRLPFHEEMKAFRSREDIPLLASAGRRRRADIAAITGTRVDLPWILLSFTSLEWNDPALDAVERISDYEFLTVLPLSWSRSNIHCIDRAAIPFSDVLASADAVISKPGYGILSDCAVNGKPLIYAEREDFVEFPVLEAALKRHLRHLHIPAARLYRGDIREALEAIWEVPAAEVPLQTGGAPMAARRMLEILGR